MKTELWSKGIRAGDCPEYWLVLPVADVVEIVKEKDAEIGRLEAEKKGLWEAAEKWYDEEKERVQKLKDFCSECSEA